MLAKGLSMWLGAVAGLVALGLFWWCSVAEEEDNRKIIGIESNEMMVENKKTSQDQRLSQVSSEAKYGAFEQVGNREIAQKNNVPDFETLHGEIKKLNDSQIALELARLKAEIYDLDLIDRLNRGQLDSSEQDDAQVIIDRVVILGIEKTERKLANMLPDLEKAIVHQERRIANARKFLAEEGGY